MGWRARACAAMLCVAFAAAMCGTPVLAAEPKLPLVDEGAADASWVRFRNQLLAALKAKDRKHLLSIMDRKVRNGIGNENGVEAFRTQWGLHSDESPLWSELSSALFLGSAYLKSDKKGPRELCAPYIIARWPEELDPFDHGVVVARETTARAEPAAGGTPVGTLSYDIVPVTDWDVPDAVKASPQRWVKIRLNNRDAYLPEEHVRSPVEHSACFLKTAQGWRLTGFAPGGGDGEEPHAEDPAPRKPAAKPAAKQAPPAANPAAPSQ